MTKSYSLVYSLNIIEKELNIMPKKTIKLSEPLYQQVLLTMQERGLDNVSDTIRLLLHLALENQTTTASKSPSSRLQKKAASYTIMAYCLIEKFLITSVKNGQILTDEAHDKAEKLINSLIQKLSEE
jgi:predicted transcriptional regulator